MPAPRQPKSRKDAQTYRHSDADLAARPEIGAKFGSSFQPFVRKRDVADNDDADMTREPAGSTTDLVNCK